MCNQAEATCSYHALHLMTTLRTAAVAHIPMRGAVDLQRVLNSLPRVILLTQVVSTSGMEPTDAPKTDAAESGKHSAPGSSCTLEEHTLA